MWVLIEDFPRYSVSDQGEFRNDQTKRTLKTSRNQQGILLVSLRHDGRSYTRSVTRLVAENLLETHPLETFDTPIHLDGNKANAKLDNLKWRPRWFAIKYHQQFEEEYDGPYFEIQEVNSGEVYDNPFEAATKHGLLVQDVLWSMYNKQYVFPSYLEFVLFE